MSAFNLLNISSKKIRYGLNRTNQLLSQCNLLDNHFFKIQIVGTNGKGTVAAFLTKALIDAGYNVGTYTSPHLLKENERIRVNGKKISDQNMRQFIIDNKQLFDEIKPSFFEIMTAMAVWFFKKKHIQIAILETGLGGRYDSVTACKANMLLFTSISMDHHQILGSTLSKIAEEKAKAITQKGQLIISVKQEKRVNKILDIQAKKHQNIICFLDQKKKMNFDLKYLYGKHQEQNANLAYYCLEKLQKNKIIDTSHKKMKKSINNTRWPGRFQIILNKPLIIYDVAHNKSSLSGFLQAFIGFNKTRKSQNKYLICAFEHNKKIISSLKKYEKHFNKIICTETNIRQSMEAKEMSKLFYNNKKITLIKNIDKAIQHIKTQAQNQDVVAIIGSHFIAPAINRNFKNSFVDNI